MRLFNFIGSQTKNWSRATRRRSANSQWRSPSFRPCVEILEGRCLLSVGREWTLSAAAPVFQWDGPTATSGSVPRPDESDDSTFNGNSDDFTLLHIEVPDDTFWDTHAGGLNIRVFDYRGDQPESTGVASEFELYVYRSDAEGNPLEQFEVGLNQVGAEEWATISRPSGYYLIRVEYAGVVASSYTGVATLGSYALEVPSGASLPVVSSGARPGPDVLYAPPPAAPQLEYRDPRFRAAPLLVCGTEAYQDGEYLYQDYLQDDWGADTNGVDGATALNAGEMKYPTDLARYGGNAADLVEFRIAAAADSVAYRFTLNTLLQDNSTIIVLAYERDDDASTGSPTLPLDPGAEFQMFPGTDDVLTVWGAGATYSRWIANQWVSTDVSINTDLEANQITVLVPRWLPDGTTLSNPHGAWKATLALGLYDSANHGWLRPNDVEDWTYPGDGNPLVQPSGIFNVGFRFKERITGRDASPDFYQAQQLQVVPAIHQPNPMAFAHEINFGWLDERKSFSTVPTAGGQVRIFPSRLQVDLDGNGVPDEGRRLSTVPAQGVTPAFVGHLQSYYLYVPVQAPEGLTLALHGADRHYHQDIGTSFAYQLAELRNQLLAMPDARGPFGAYRNEAEVDVFEVYSDIAAHFNFPSDHVALSGLSMGGLGAYRLGTLYPDLFGNVYTMIAPPGEGAWIPPNYPVGDPRRPPRPGETYPLLATPETLTTFWLENARNVPFYNLAAIEDEIVPFIGPFTQNLGLPATASDALLLGELGDVTTGVEIDGFAQLGYRFQFRAYHGEHLTIPEVMDHHLAAVDFLGDSFVDRNTAHVTFAYVPATDDPTLGMVHDHGYWVSALMLADLDRPTLLGGVPYPAKGVIDVFSHAFGRRDVPNELVGPTEGHREPYSYVEWERTWDSTTIAKANRLDVTLTNLSAVTIDLRRANIDLCQAITLSIDTDSSATLLLSGPSAAASVTGASSWEQTADGIKITLNPSLLSGHFDVTIVPKCPDLRVTKITVADNRAAQGDKLIITAIITNNGTLSAATSATEFRLDEATVLGLVTTPEIPAGQSVTVSVSLGITASMKGEHTIRVTADHTAVVKESNEDNNVSTLRLTIKGNTSSDNPFIPTSGSTSNTSSDGNDDSSPLISTPTESVDEFFATITIDDDTSLLSQPLTSSTSDDLAVVDTLFESSELLWDENSLTDPLRH